PPSYMPFPPPPPPPPPPPHSFPTRRSSDLSNSARCISWPSTASKPRIAASAARMRRRPPPNSRDRDAADLAVRRRLRHRARGRRSEEHTSELQSQSNLVCRLLLEKKKKRKI